jgi:hypothetical protein
VTNTAAQRVTNEKGPVETESQSLVGAGNEIRLRLYECSALHQYRRNTQAKPSTLTTSTLAIFA